MSEDQKSHIYHLDDKSLLAYYCLPSCEQQDITVDFFPKKILLKYSFTWDIAWCHIINKFYYVNKTEWQRHIICVEAYILFLQLFLLSVKYHGYLKVNIHNFQYQQISQK